jgi:predicted CopG family antitoxin
LSYLENNLYIFFYLKGFYISKDEIFKCLRKLKNEKASGEDEIINEYIKSTVNQFINVYEKIFNVIFDNGIMQFQKRLQSEHIILSGISFAEARLVFT